MSFTVTLADFFLYGIPESARGDADNEAEIVGHINAATSIAYGYVSSIYPTPLPDAPILNLRSAICRIAAFMFLANHRGGDFSAPADQAVKDSHDQAIILLRDVANARVRLDIPSTGTPSAPGARVYQRKLRGW